MYAARGNDVEVFNRVWEMYHHHQRTFSTTVEGLGSSPSDTLTKVDHTERNVLHHAAEAGCLDALAKVIVLVRRISGDSKTMHKPDKNGLTPLHHLLRAKYGEPEGRDEIRPKFEQLWLHSNKGSFMVPRRVMPLPCVGRADVAVMAVTELIHAARGGLPSLKFVLAKIRLMKFWRGQPDSTVVTINEALRVTVDGENGDEDVPKQGALDAWGWGMLLAAAAKGGHVDVLETVVHAIAVSMYATLDIQLKILHSFNLIDVSVQRPPTAYNSRCQHLPDEMVSRPLPELDCQSQHATRASFFVMPC